MQSLLSLFPSPNLACDFKDLVREFRQPLWSSTSSFGNLDPDRANHRAAATPPLFDASKWTVLWRKESGDLVGHALLPGVDPEQVQVSSKDKVLTFVVNLAGSEEDTPKNEEKQSQTQASSSEAINAVDEEGASDDDGGKAEGKESVKTGNASADPVWGNAKQLRRDFRFSELYDTEKATVHLAKGVLFVRIPKKPQEEPTTIKVQVSG